MLNFGLTSREILNKHACETLLTDYLIAKK